MSRYVNVALDLRSLDEVAAALTALELPFERGRERVMLEGSLECAGEPVDIRLPAGTLGTVEDFGFVTAPDGTIRLVCGELDASPLRDALLTPLRTTVVTTRLEAAGLAVDQVEITPDGTRRLLVHDD